MKLLISIQKNLQCITSKNLLYNNWFTSLSTSPFLFIVITSKILSSSIPHSQKDVESLSLVPVLKILSYFNLLSVKVTSISSFHQIFDYSFTDWFLVFEDSTSRAIDISLSIPYLSETIRGASVRSAHSSDSVLFLTTILEQIFREVNYKRYFRNFFYRGS